LGIAPPQDFSADGLYGNEFHKNNVAVGVAEVQLALAAGERDHLGKLDLHDLRWCL
jgi:hypothetical protein